MNDGMLAVLVSLASLCLGVYTGISTVRRGARAEQRRDVSELAMVIVKLEDISAGISEIKSDVSYLKGDIRELTERMIVAEQKLMQADKRMDAIEERG